jgi:hypothetical protein
MPIGPVQLLVIGFERPDLDGGVLAELERLREDDGARLLDLLLVHKDADGAVRRLDHPGGDVVGALIGLDEPPGADPLPAAEFWTVGEAIPNDSAAAIALVEHRWAIGARDAIRDAGGEAIADEWVHPADLAAAGLADAE